MKIKNLLILFFLCCFSCKNKSEQHSQEKFDKIKWAANDGKVYQYRNNMLNDLVYNQNLKGLKYDNVIDMLGQPDRTDNGHLFYTIVKEYLANTDVIVHSKSLVIKLAKDSTVEWRKIHE